MRHDKFLLIQAFVYLVFAIGLAVFAIVFTIKHL